MDKENTGLFKQMGNILSRLKKLVTRKDVYEGFVLKGTVSEMSFMAVIISLYQVSKVLFGIFNFAACPSSPAIPLYHVASAILMLLHLPMCLQIGDKACGEKTYLRVVIFLQSAWLIVGSYFVYHAYGKDSSCGGFLLKFSMAAVTLEWTLLIITLLIRGFVVLLFHSVVLLLSAAFRMLLSLVLHSPKKQKKS